jgi:hypothetical protein
MPSVSTKPLKDKDFTKQYGERMVYSYGCPEGVMDQYVYRIAVINPDGVLYDLPWRVVKAKCVNAGIKHVPEVEFPLRFDASGVAHDEVSEYLVPIDVDPEPFQGTLLKHLETVCSGPDLVCAAHIREGIVIRRDGLDGRTEFFKLKSPEYLLLNHAAPDDTPDIEEVS